MKKLYILFFGALAVFTASAGLQKQTLVSLPKSHKIVADVERAEKVNVANTNAMTISNIKEIEGDWVWTCFSLIKNQEVQIDITIKVKNQLKGDVEISGITGFGAIKGTYNVSKKTLTIPNMQDLGLDSYGDQTYFYFKDFDPEAGLVDGKADIESAVATFEDGVFSFPELNIWAVGDPDAEQYGWYALTAFNEIIDPSLAVPPVEYTEEYSGTMIENTVFSVLTKGSVSETPYDVTVYADADHTHFLIEDAWQGLYTALNFNGKSPDLEIDATDPDALYFVGQSTGINATGYGVVYVGTALGIVDGATEAVTLAKTETGYTIEMPVHSTFIEFSDSNEAWWGNQKAATVINITTESSAINEIGTVDNNAATEYFNLQGVRVDNPAKGGVYIVRKGSAVSKQLVK